MSVARSFVVAALLAATSCGPASRPAPVSASTPRCRLDVAARVDGLSPGLGRAGPDLVGAAAREAAERFDGAEVADALGGEVVWSVPAACSGSAVAGLAAVDVSLSALPSTTRRRRAST